MPKQPGHPISDAHTQESSASITTTATTPHGRACPLVVYDGACGFCKLWIERWRDTTGPGVRYVPSHEATALLPQLTGEPLAEAIHLVQPDGQIKRGAAAVFEALATVPGQRRLAWCYRRVPGFAPCSEAAYRFVSHHRPFLLKLTHLLWGKSVRRAGFGRSAWLFVRLLGLVYLVAFASLAAQLRGLIGSHGILPATDFLAAVKSQLGRAGYWHVPTLAWLNRADWFLATLALGGAIVAILPILGIAAGPAFLLLWVLYLSLVSVGQDFLSFQWDILLLEAGFVAVFFAPWKILWRSAASRPPSGAIRWLLWWLLFRLTFGSGIVKLKSGDVVWRNLTALNFHYETQPLPTWIGWWAHQLPAWFQKFSTFSMFAIELGAPLLIFAPRRIRHLGATAMIGLQLLIAATGNYTFFNLLTIALCLLLFDDVALGRWLPHRETQPPVTRSAPWQRGLTAAFAALVLILTGLQFSRQLSRPWPFPNFGKKIISWAAPLRTFNTYGLFAVMTRPRREIIIEGSNDGATWEPYEFKWKPGNLYRAPAFVAPHQPRLDWQMWFAALGSAENNPWFQKMLARLLQGEPTVLALLAYNPFPDTPPKFIRGLIYEYHFTTPAERSSDGSWWQRTLLGNYTPVLSLRQ